jgi:hypothetical protein
VSIRVGCTVFKYLHQHFTAVGFFGCRSDSFDHLLERVDCACFLLLPRLHYQARTYHAIIVQIMLLVVSVVNRFVTPFCCRQLFDSFP